MVEFLEIAAVVLVFYLGIRIGCFAIILWVRYYYGELHDVDDSSADGRESGIL